MILDILELVVPDPSIRLIQGLSGSTPSWTYLSPKPDANGLLDLVYMKGQNVDPAGAGYIAGVAAGKGGFPWDWFKVCADYLRIVGTEYKWSDPTTMKLGRLLGQRRMPRWVDWSPQQAAPVVAQFTLSPPETNYVIIDSGGMNTALGSSNGDVRCTFRGPYAGAAVGDLPAGEDWFADYERNGNHATGVYLYKETIAHRVVVPDPTTWRRFAWGRWQWQQFRWNGTAYAQDVDANGKPLLSQTTTVLKQPCPTPYQGVF